jgi:hypothetical protein
MNIERVLFVHQTFVTPSFCIFQFSIFICLLTQELIVIMV